MCIHTSLDMFDNCGGTREERFQDLTLDERERTRLVMLRAPLNLDQIGTHSNGCRFEALFSGSVCYRKSILTGGTDDEARSNNGRGKNE